MKSQLLPEGFRDCLPDIAELEHNINSIFLHLMRSNGFKLVKPPLVEFENSLFSLKKDKENIESFRVMDPLTQKIMGIRSDITMQIARISCGSLSKTMRPLRLCYSGEVLKVKNNNINLSRQFTQIGSEIIGVEKNFCLSELINLIIEILGKLGIKKIIINFSMPNLINLISDELNLNKSNLETLINCYRNKNLYEIKNISDKLFKISEFLLENIGKIDEKFDNIKKFNFPKNIGLEIESFIEQVKKIKDEFNDYEIIIDPLEIDESNYHTGFCFKVYTENSREIFSGGGYTVGDERCVGFSGFLENLILESKFKKNVIKKIFAPYNLDIKKKNMIQKNKSFIIIKATKFLNEKQLMNEARKQKCNFYFFNDKVIEVD